MPRAVAALVVGSLLLAPPSVRAQDSGLLTARFERYLDALRRQAGIPGLSAAIVQDGVITWEVGLGHQDRERNIPASPDTPYYLGDLTQTFTATLLLQCAEQGLLSLGDPVLVPRLDTPVPDQATVLQVLSHTRPDGVFEYNPARFTALTAVASRCADDSFRERMVRAIVDRFAMTRTLPGIDVATVQPPDFDVDRLAAFAALVPQVATPYHVDGDGHASPTALPPDGLNAAVGMISTVRDLARFDAALDSGALLLPETLTAAWSPGIDALGTPRPFGLGWFVQTYRGEQIVWHFGYTPDVGSALMLKLPARHTTLILLANSDMLSAQFDLAAGDVTLSPFARLFLDLIL
jgi:CubicO group peptidase (beta-lactamase class C family)